MSWLEAAGVFVGIPLAILILVAVLVSAPSSKRDGRYRPDLEWEAEPIWFNGPERAVHPDTGRIRRSQRPEQVAPTVGGAGATW